MFNFFNILLGRRYILAGFTCYLLIIADVKQRYCQKFKRLAGNLCSQVLWEIMLSLWAYVIRVLFGSYEWTCAPLHFS